ncbi:GNAT family N-acetyltransferase [Pseudoneobacillus sp. C159]
MDEKRLIINLSGKLVSLGPLRSDLVSLYNRWNNDFQTTRTLASTRPVILEEEISAFEQIARNRENIFFAIYEKETLQPIGNTFLSDVDYKNGIAEFNIVIGEKDHRGKGYGTEVSQLVLDYGFNIIGLHNIFLRVYEFNQNAIQAYKKAGFVECGRRREAHHIGGRKWDIIFMEALATEFESPLIKKELFPDELK